MDSIVLLVIAICYIMQKIRLNYRINNYDVTKISSSRLAQDAGKSQGEIRRNMINCKYNKRSDDLFWNEVRTW